MNVHNKSMVKNVIQFPVREKKQIIGSKLSNKYAM
ncbi:hypothetical protein IJ22_46760 [Paenibacillus naphthalenovorans]|uniref:Uncharacterized protein n=1 Tax=Paenibacillus naphthalenovorans TaxID=162209 RepID=A0A0U2WI09_9BACL|nr:hypothetical protein IJ22_46760 [Paenibacillus naphthalenovorans]